MLNGEPMPPTPANVKYAHRLASEIRDRIKHGTFSMAEYFPASGAGGTLTVASQLDTWLDAQRVATSTKAAYSSASRFWKATIGDQPLRGLKHSQVLAEIARRPDLKGKTINNYVSVLREAMQLAVVDRLMTANPVDGVPRARSQKDPPDPFSRDEAEAIIADMLARQPEPVANMVEAWFFTGMRTSEVFGQRWPNVDLRKHLVLVSEAVVRGETKTTKTDVAREVRLNSRALAAVQRQAKHTRLAGEYVWQDPRYGTPWVDERAFRRSYWEPTLKRLGIRYRRPYAMRHTYATMMLMAGMTPAFCAKQLGHSVEMFLRTYSRWLDGQQNDLEMARLEAALGGPSAKEMNR
jgi:integrase